MTVDQLACFLAVAELGNFTRAAERLYISHSAVSKAIAALEDGLGVQLMVRDSRSVSLTPAGELLRERGGHVYNLWQDLEERVQTIGRDVHGALSLLAPYLYSPDMFPIYLQMKERHPQVELRIRPGEPLTIYQAVRNGHVEAGITFSFSLPAEDEGVDRLTLFQDRFCAVLSPNHPFAALSAVSTAQMLGEPMVFPPRPELERHPALLRQIYRPMLPRDYQAADLEDCLLQVALGKGGAILPGLAVQAKQIACRSVPLSDGPEPFFLVLLWRRNFHTPALDRFIELARTSRDAEITGT